MRNRPILAGILAAVLIAGAGPVRAEEPQLYFTSTIDVNAECTQVWKTLTEFQRLQQLVPHLHGEANVPRATSLGDALFYEIEQDGGKATGKFVITRLEPAYKLQVIVQPDEGPWLRVQEFTLFSQPDKEKKGSAGCHVNYEESYNQMAFRYENYDASLFVRDLREPYMEIVLRRMKNISEGKPAGPKEEVEKLAKIAKNFP